MKKAQSARFLNENSNWLGLTVFDLVALGYIFIGLYHFFEKLRATWISFFMIALISLALIHIRLKARTKFIRDFLAYAIRSKFQEYNREV